MGKESKYLREGIAFTSQDISVLGLEKTHFGSFWSREAFPEEMAHEPIPCRDMHFPHGRCHRLPPLHGTSMNTCQQQEC